MSGTLNHTVGRYLDRVGIGFAILPHEHAETAWAEAAALGLPAAEVAKTVVVCARDGYVRAVLPASERLDLKRLRGVLRTEGELRLATEEELERDFAEFELGAVPPVGGHTDPVVVDRRLAGLDAVVLAAGSQDESLRLDTWELIELAGAHVGDICLER